MLTTALDVYQLPMQSVSRALISVWILEQVELVIVFSIIPRSSLVNLCDNLLSLGRKVLCLDFLGDTLCNVSLLGTVREDGRPILCTHH